MFYLSHIQSVVDFLMSLCEQAKGIWKQDPEANIWALEGWEYENGEWRSFHNEELHGLYCSPNTVRVIKSKRLRWAGYLARMVEGRSAFKMLTDKPAGKIPLGRSRHK